MLTDAELHQRFEHHQTPEIGRARIRLIRDSLPSRPVRSNKASGKHRYTPIKMTFVVEAEAFSTEYVAIVEWDHDSETLEYYAQPEPLKITYLAPNRVRAITTHTTPDYLRITKSAFVFVECKREEHLERLAKEMPNRYQRDGDGRWRSPPAEAAAAELGCEFAIRSSRENNWALHENLELLKDFQIGEPVTVDPAVIQDLNDRLSRAGWASVFELVHHEPAIAADDLYALIAARKVFFPLDTMRLSDQERATVFRDEITYRAREAMVATHTPRSRAVVLGLTIEAGLAFDWDGSTWQILNDGTERLTIKRLNGRAGKDAIAELTREELVDFVRAGRITLHQTDEQVSTSDGAELLGAASTENVQEALWRLEILEDRADPDDNPLVGKCRRTRLYWLCRYRLAEVQYGNGLIGLLPRRSGNRKPKASPAALDLANEVIASDWETIRRKKRLASCGRYRVLAKEKGLTPVSYRHFCTMVKVRAGHTQAVTRIGDKAAYDLEPHYLELEWTTPRHGVRPWHICHIDHTPLPLKFVHSSLATEVSSVWLTILTDAFSRKVLAYYLSFDEPSRRSCMMVIRDCVRRHNRVPQMLVCDQGPDFMSVYFEMLLARLRISKRERRAGKPKEGSVCERIFNTTQSQFVKVLLGATDLVEQYFRSISPEVDPSRHAVWTLERFDQGFESYLDKVYHENHHAGLGKSPNAEWALGLKSHGHRKHRFFPFDKAFITATCPSVLKGTAKVCAGGIKINYRWFNCPEFHMPGVLGTSVEARYDPFNCGVAYAYVRGQWHTCHSEFYASFSHLSERAVWLATERLKFQDRQAGRQLNVTAERLALFMLDRERDEEVARQLRNDAEAAPHRQKIQRVSAIAPAAHPPATPSLPAPTGAAPAAAPTRMQRRPVRVLEDL